MKGSELDKAFEDGADIDHLIDWSSVRRPNRDGRRLELELSSSMASAVDLEARRLGLTPQALIERWIAEKTSATRS